MYVKSDTMKGGRAGGLVQYLADRERGLRHSTNRQADLAQLLGEDKATLPVKNQSCELSGQSRATFLMAFSPDGTKIASTHGDHTVRVTDINSGRCTHILTGHPRTPWCIAFHPSSNDILASGCLGGEVRIWDLRGGGSERWKSEESSVIASVTFHPTDQVLVIATGNELHFWDWTQLAPFARCKTASKYERVKWVKFDPLGHKLLTGIANTMSPMDEVPPPGTQVNHIDTPEDQQADSVQRQAMRRRYNRLVHQITANQRDRITTQYPAGSGLVTPPAAGGRPVQLETAERRPEPAPPTSTNQIGGMTFSGPHHVDIDIVEPQSPVHLEALENARQYASAVTHSAMAGGRPYAAGLESARLAGVQHEDVEREVIRVRNDHALEDHMDTLDSDPVRPGPQVIAGGPAGPSMETEPQHSTLSGQELSSLLNSVPQPLGAGSLPPSHPTAIPPRVGRNEPHDSIIESLITSTQLSQDQPLTSSTASAAQTSGAPNNNNNNIQQVPPPVSLSSTGAFTSILRSRLATSNSLSSAAPRSATARTSTTSGSHGGTHSFLRAQLTHRPGASSTAFQPPSLPSSTAPVVISSSSTSSSPHPSRPSRPWRAGSTVRLLLEQEDRASPFTSSASLPSPVSVVSSESRTGLTNTFSIASLLASNNTTSDESAPESVDSENQPAAATGSGSTEESGPRCQVCGHTYQPPHTHTPLTVPLAGLPQSQTAQDSDSPRPGPAGITPDSVVRLRLNIARSGLPSTDDPPASTSSDTVRLVIRTSQSEPSVTATNTVSSSSVRSRGGRSRRRFAQFLESEVRQAIDRVRARQLDIQETLQALDHLQSEAAVAGADQADHSDTSRLESVQLEVVQDAQPMETALDANAITIERTRSSDVPSMDFGTDVTSLTESSSEAILTSSMNIPENVPADSQQGRSTVSALSAELNRRIDHLNRLERNVSEITQRLSARMRNLNEQRWRNLGHLRRRMSNAPCLTSSHLRERQERLRAHLQDINRRYRNPGAPRVIPEITITPSETSNNNNNNTVSEAEAELHRLQDSLGESRQAADPPRLTDVQRNIQNIRADIVRRRQQERERQRTWHSLQRRHLHPHYAVSILDDTINRQNDGLQAAINRAIAGAFMGTGEAAVASNIVNLTHRIQAWDFTRFHIPDISDASVNVVVPHCKLHNDASCDISQDGRFLSTFVPSHRGFPDDTILAVFSLEPNSVGKCLYTKSFGPNAISVSLSPLSNFVLVGLAAKRLAWVFTPKQMVAQVYKLKKKMAGEDSMEHICDLMHPCDLDIRSHISVNSARWLPRVGEGVVYGTNRGDLHICRPGDDEKDPKSQRNLDADGNESHSIRRNIMQMLGIAVPSTTSTSTQTIHRLRRTASTQTEGPQPAEHT